MAAGAGALLMLALPAAAFFIFYDEDKLTRFLLAHLPPSQRVPQPDLARALMKRTPMWLQWAIGLPVAAAVAFELWRAFGP